MNSRMHASLLSAGVMLSSWLLVAGPLLTAQEAGQVQPAQRSEPALKKPKTRVLRWEPPQPGRQIHSDTSAAPCVLPTVLKQAGERANALFDGLKSFTAREDIQFEKLAAYPQDEFNRTYDYRVVFRPSPSGLVLQDSRDSRGGRKLQLAFDQDLGLPELALIFLPGMQADYDFKCEGTTLWKGQPAFVIDFQQRQDKPRRTASFRGERAGYPASLRGRAWMATESGEVQHMETSLMAPIPEVGVQNWYLVIDYAPVLFPEKNVRMILPQTVDAYCEFPEWRTIAYHTFSDFKLFAVESTLKPFVPAAQ